MALGLHLTPSSPPIWLLACTDVSLLAASWLLALHKIDQDHCLRLIKTGNPRLGEALRTQFELDRSNEPSGSEPAPFFLSAGQYFRKRHLDEVSAHIRDTLPPNTGWRSAVLAAVLVQVMLGGLSWWNAHGGRNTVLFPRDISSQAQSIRILYPAYLHKPPLQLDVLPKRLNTPLGARLEIFRDEKPKSLAFMQFVSDNDVISVQWSRQGMGWTASLTPESSGTLRFDEDPGSIEWEVAPDQKPLLKVNWMDIPHVFDDSNLFVEIYAEDDHGLHQVVLRYQVEGEPRIMREILQSYEVPFAHYRESYDWDLSRTPLRAGDVVTVWVEASDRDNLNGPHISLSGSYQFHVESRLAYHSAVLKQFEHLKREMRDLLELLDLQALPDTTIRETRILADLERLGRDVVHDALLTPLLRQFPRELYAQLQWFQQERGKAEP